MTSEEIRGLKNALDGEGCAQQAKHGAFCETAMDLFLRSAILEVSYQLAVANEREAKTQERCPRCGRPWWSHSPQECSVVAPR